MAQAGSYPIRKVAVLGAGVMGSGIAAHLANAGIPSILFDIVPKDAGDDPKARNMFALKGIETAKKLKPAPLFRKELASLISPANYDDHADQLASCDLIIEVVVERLDIKQKVYEWVAANRRDDAIVASNTSGIRLEDMAANMPLGMRQHFVITHFFNPVRYMRLLEIVGGADTLPEVVQGLSTFGADTLGKGIVVAKDTPNFVANRIGIFGMVSTFRAVEEMGLSIEQVDAIMGPALGRPKTAFFRLADLVGLDTMGHVITNIHEYAPNDERRDWFVVPDVVKKLVAAGATGNKTGAGFYKKGKIDGKRAFFVLDLKTGEYREADKSAGRFPCTGAARKAETPEAKVAAMVWGDADDIGSTFAWRTTAESLIYAANRIPEIADDILNIDNGMKWGFAWDLGVFETWDAIGVRRSVERMEAEGYEVPAWVKAMLDAGRESFYGRDAEGRPTYWSIEGEAKLIVGNPNHLFIADLKAKNPKPVARNPSASLHDMGDGILNLEFHSKMNALDDGIFDLYELALDRLDDGTYDGLVVGNEGKSAFCAGANLLMVLMGAAQGAWDDIDKQIGRLQQLLMRAKYSKSPVVTAAHGMTLGGGCEVAMQSSATIGTGELYMGLVEVGVGLIPGAGGCKEMVMRYTGDIPADINVDVNPFIQKAFERLGTAQVTTSGGEAQAWGFLRPTDFLVLDVDARLAAAKKLARGLADGGYRPPAQRTAPAAGAACRGAIEGYLYQMSEGGYATPHDLVVGKALANVLTGGDVPAGTRLSEQAYLDLEREAFLFLCGTEATRARMTHFLQTGKPLRN